jgi:hypothetical protein
MSRVLSFKSLCNKALSCYKNLTNDKTSIYTRLDAQRVPTLDFFRALYKNGTLLAFYDLETYKTQGNYRWKLQLLVQVWRV